MLFQSIHVIIEKWGNPRRNLLPGQSPLLQDSTTRASPSHGTPPNMAGTSSNLCFSNVPSPHVAEHSPTINSLHSQSTKMFYINIVENLASLNF